MASSNSDAVVISELDDAENNADIEQRHYSVPENNNNNNVINSTKPRKPRVNFDDSETANVRRSSGILIVLVGFSILVLADGLVVARDDTTNSLNTGAAIGISLVSLILTFVKYCYAQFGNGQFLPPVEIIYSGIMIIIWTAGVVTLTFAKNGTFLNDPSTGFFSTWFCLLLSGYYVFAVFAHKNATAGSKSSSGIIDFKPGVTPIIAVAMLLIIGVMAQASLHIKNGFKFKARAGFALAMAVPSFIILATMLFMKIDSYGDPNVYFFVTALLVLMWALVIFFCTFSQPFSVKVPFVDPDTASLPVDEQDTDFDLIVVGNGFFATIGTFIATVIIMWRSHKIILKDNEKSGTSYGMQGRHIWLGLLGLSSIVVLVSAIIECNNFDSCQENQYVGAALGLSFFSLVLAVLAFIFCRFNKDLGDIAYLNPDTIFMNPETTEEKSEIIMAVALFLMWAGAVIGFTFATESPFNETKTAYLFIWLSFIFSSLFLNHVFPKFGLLNLTCLNWQPPNKMSPKRNFGFLMILVASSVQVAAISGFCIEDLQCGSSEITGYAFIGFILILTAVLLSMKPTQLGHAGIILVYMLVILVYSQLLVLTVVVGPFDKTQGNGFYATWISLFGAVYVANHYQFHLSEL